MVPWYYPPIRDDDYSEILQHYELDLKKLRKKYFWQKFHVFFNSICTLLVIWQLIYKISQGNPIWVSLLCIIIWLFSLSLSIKNLSTGKKFLNQKIDTYNELLKTVDYPKYIRQQRLKKIKRLHW